MTNIAYTEEERKELSKLFAEALYDALQAKHPDWMIKVTREVNAQAQKLPWFRYRGNEYGLLRHLEEMGVYGVFDFPTDRRSALYLHAVFGERFCIFAKQHGLSKNGFVKGLTNPKSEATKPEGIVELGKAPVGRVRSRPFNI